MTECRCETPNNCKYCNPTHYIKILEDQQKDLDRENETLTNCLNTCLDYANEYLDDNIALSKKLSANGVLRMIKRELQGVLNNIKE